MKRRTEVVLPDFVVIGGSKSGTVWMNECLREHPDVYLTPDVHEVFFFDRYFDRGIEWYAHYFRGYAGQKRVGEITSEYLAHPLAPERLRAVLPDATLIASLRNPVQRACSKYLHMWRKGDIPPHLSFWQACEYAPQIISDGEYFRCLRPWRELFSAEQLRLLVLDDAALDPFAYMRRVYELLDVDPDFRAATTTERANEHQTPRSMWGAKVAFRGSRLLHRSGLHAAVELGKQFGLDRLVLKDGKDPAKDPTPLSEEDRERLSAHYRNDVAALSELVGRDLVGLWLHPPVAASNSDGDLV
jgi:hypothetical protein